MRNLTLGLLLTCALGTYLMPQMAGGCVLVGLSLAAALILDRKEVKHGNR